MYSKFVQGLLMVCVSMIFAAFSVLCVFYGHNDAAFGFGAMAAGALLLSAIAFEILE